MRKHKDTKARSKVCPFVSLCFVVAVSKKSKLQPQRELDLPRRRGRTGNLAGGIAIAVVAAVALEHNEIRVGEILAIQNMERFHAELQLNALPDGDPLKQGCVDVEQARAAERTAPHVAEGAGNRHRESFRIEPLFRSPQDHRSLEVRIPVDDVGGLRSVAGAGIIEANQRRERKSRLS